jgi:hypothetical protein
MNAPLPLADPGVAVLERELRWVSAVIDARIKLHFNLACDVADVRELAPPPLERDGSPYARALHRHGLDEFDARMMLMLALMPHLRPQLLDPFQIKNTSYDRGFTEFGGVAAGPQAGFQPTVETAAFVLCGEDLGLRLALLERLAPGQALRATGLLALEGAAPGPGLLGSVLQIHPEHLGSLTTGAAYQPAHSPAFPAVRLETALEWDDLVLAPSVREDIEEIRAWIAHGDTLLQGWQLGRQLKPGFRSLFYGPPGTGKTLTACLLGKSCALEVYRIDLSLVVSKYIGETEKNLAGVFDQARSKNWILFFDEADALFGKRTQTNSSNDRYANQEVAYLLQRVEDFAGVVILATNLRGNIDDAFARRFQSMVHFALPDAEQRAALWRKALGPQLQLAPEVDLDALAAEFEISGGAVANVVRYAALMALRRDSRQVRLADLRHGIRRELRKEGKAI